MNRKTKSFLFILKTLSIILLIFLISLQIIQVKIFTLNENNLDKNKFIINKKINPFILERENKTQIIFDASHNQVYSIWDTEICGYSELSIKLLEENYYVGQNTKNLIETISNMTNNDVLVLNVAKYGNYTNQEINAIKNFTSNGGGVLIIGEHYTTVGFNEFQNEIANEFGFNLSNDYIYDTNNSIPGTTGQWIIVESNFFNLKNITFLLTGSITTTGNATEIAVSSSESSPASKTVAAKSTFGKGRIICVADSEFIWNENEIAGISYGNNTNFIMKIFNWLSKKGQSSNISITPEYKLFTSNNFILNITINQLSNVSLDILGGIIEPIYMENVIGKLSWNITINSNGYVVFKIGNISCKIFFFKPQSNNKKVLFLNSNNCRKTDYGISNFYNFAEELVNYGINVFSTSEDVDSSNFDVIIISNPLKEFNSTQITKLKSFNRMILIGEGHSSIYSEGSFLKWVYSDMGYSVEGRQYPLNQIANEYSLNFTYYYPIDLNNNYNNNPLYPKLNSLNSNYNFYSYFSSVILFESSYKIYSQCSQQAWGEYDLLFGFCANEVENNSEDIEYTNTIVYDSKILAIGDCDIFTNEENNIKSFELVAIWILTGVLPSSPDNTNYFWIYIIIAVISAIIISTVIIYIKYFTPKSKGKNPKSKEKSLKVKKKRLKLKKKRLKLKKKY